MLEIIRRNTEYGIRALIALAGEPGSVMSAREISMSQEIPLELLHKILQRFIHAGLVLSRRGPQGGFVLARDPASVSVLDVVELLQGRPAVNRCFVGVEGCPRAVGCPLKNKWLDMEVKIAELMREISLQDLVDEVKGNRCEEEPKRPGEE